MTLHIISEHSVGKGPDLGSGVSMREEEVHIRMSHVSDAKFLAGGRS